MTIHHDHEDKVSTRANPPPTMEVGKRMLVTTNNWFYAPDGKAYKAVFGTVRSIKSDTETLGIKTNARATNWYVQIGNVMIAGCQIHYAVECEECHLGDVQDWTSEQGHHTHPSFIYGAE